MGGFKLSEIKKHVITGISFMIPIVVGAGLCAALGTAIGGTKVSEAEGTLLWYIWRTGKIGMGFVVPVITAAIAYSIADRPAIEPGLNKPISMINPGPTPIDLVGYYRDIGLEAYMAHDYEEYNRILTCLQVRKAVANTKILILQFRADAGIGQYQLL